MFKNTITSTPLVTEAADEYFGGKISGSSWMRDFSFLSTLRALLAPRMKDGDKLRLGFTDSSYNASQLNGLSDAQIMEVIVGSRAMEENCIYIHNFHNHDPEANHAWITAVGEKFVSRTDGWVRIEKVTAFYRKVFTVFCFINPEKKSVYLFTDNMDVRRMHYLQCGIFAFIPWYFDPEQGVSDLEMALCNSLREKTSSKYEECIAKIAEQYDFETARIKKLLRGFETQYEKKQCDTTKREIDRILQSLRDLDEKYADFLLKKRDKEIMLMGLEAKIAEHGEDSEIMDYFLCHKQLILESVRDGMMDFTVRTTMDYYDEELVKRVVENRNSCLYQQYGEVYVGGQISLDEMRLLMRYIFLDQTLRIRVCAAYRFEMGGSVLALNGHEYGPKCTECLPNPHIDRYACLGNYKRTINERLKENDYIGAIEQCISSAKSLNFGDGAVMNEFVSKIYGFNSRDRGRRFIEDPDGNVLTVKEAVAWIKKHEEAGEKTDEPAAPHTEEG